MRIAYFLTITVVLLSFSSKAATKSSMTRSQYILGGVVGTGFGCGLGHAIQGRYREVGWKYTAVETGFILGGMVFGAGLSANGQRPVGGILFATGLAGYIVTRVFEAVDVWNTETSVTFVPIEKGAQIALTYRF